MRERQSIPTALSVIVLIDTTSVLVCFTWLGIRSKMVEGYPELNYGNLELTGSAIFLRHWGLLFVLLPSVWAIYALVAHRIDPVTRRPVLVPIDR